MNLVQWMLIVNRHQLGERSRRRQHGLDPKYFEHAQSVLDARAAKEDCAAAAEDIGQKIVPERARKAEAHVDARQSGKARSEQIFKPRISRHHLFVGQSHGFRIAGGSGSQNDPADLVAFRLRIRCRLDRRAVACDPGVIQRQMLRGWRKWLLGSADHRVDLQPGRR
jgi:hypothetical protein